MEFLKYFNSFINENDGIGHGYFQVKKEDKAYAYYFKIDDSGEERAFFIKMGKFSKTEIVNEAETAYAVISIDELSVSDMEAFLINEAPYKLRDEGKISVSSEELNAIGNILTKILDDYLQKAPKVTKIYDEILDKLNINLEEYKNFSNTLINSWSNGRWSAQEGSSQSSILYTKVSHS